MSSEVHFLYANNQTAYFVVRNASGQVWGGSAFESWTRGAAVYAQTLTGDNGSYYVGDFPSSIEAGKYVLQFFLQEGAAPANGDDYMGNERFYWDGAEPLTVSEDARINGK